jgi:rubrerythrin
MPPSGERQRAVIEQQATVKALKTALQMEVEGKAFYEQAARDSRDDLGKKLLSALAGEEDIHRQVFLRIYEAISAKKGWPDSDLRPDGGRHLRSILGSSTGKGAARVTTSADELAAVAKARMMEGKTYDFYQHRRQEASDPAEREFYEKLAAQEQQHTLVLADYHEYLVNPAGWFVNKEHPSLD